MRGAGLSGVALLASDEKELCHFMLQRLLKRSGLTIDSVFLATTQEAHLKEILSKRNVKVVVPLGERALIETLGQNDIIRWRGRVADYPTLPGHLVVPTFAPSQLLARRHGGDDDDDAMRHPPRFHGVWMRDVQRAIEVAKLGFTRMPVNYLMDPDALVFAAFADQYFAALAKDPLTWLSWDIETPYKQKKGDESEFEEDAFDGIILRVSFCFRPGHAISVPWTPTYLPTIERLLLSRGRMVLWNGQTFDKPVVEGTGVKVNGVIYDFMDAYHLLESDLPKGLEWVSSEATDVLPWKHLASAEPAWYSATDADVALRNALYIESKLRARGQWELFEHHVVRLMPILNRAGVWGNKIDRHKRDEIRTKLIAMKNELIAEAQQYVPRELFPRHLYKGQPERVVGDFPKDFSPRELQALVGWDIRYEPSAEKVCSICGGFASNKTEHFKGAVGPVNEKTGKATRLKNPCKEKGGTTETRDAFAPRFYELEEFNPNSSPQLKAYMRHFRHPVGKDKRDATKETADAGHLKTLRKQYGVKFPMYALALELHKATKTIGTYTPEPDENDCLHTQYVNSPSTWRLGSRKVKFGTQIQNWGKREENPYAKEARKQIIARPGHKLVQIDSSAVEAVMQGYFMNDPLYMCLASKSIHAWLACRALGWEFNPENVEKVKAEHESLYLKMKVTNYLTNFGGGAYLLKETFPEQFPSRQAAEAAQASLYALLPTLKAYHHSVRWEAHTKTFLESPWGYRHYYYDVFKPSWDTTKIDFGKDAKRAVAFKPQNCNGAFQRDNLVIIGESEFGQYMPTNASVHDSACLDCPIPLVDRATEFLMSVFTRPIPQMRGLRIGAEVEVGDNWGEMERVHKVIIDDYTMAQTESGGVLLAAA